MEEVEKGDTGRLGREYREVVYASIQSALAVAATRKDFEVIAAQCEGIPGYRDVDDILRDARGKMESLAGKPDLDDVIAKRSRMRVKRRKSIFVFLAVLIVVGGLGGTVTVLNRNALRQRYGNGLSTNQWVLEKYGGEEFSRAQRTFSRKKYDAANKELIYAVCKAVERRRKAEVAERKRLAEEAKRKQLAEEAERKKLAAEEAERKRLAAEAERKRLAEEAAERQRQVEEAERQKLARLAEEQDRQRKEAEKKRLAGEEERGRLAAEVRRKLATGLKKKEPLNNAEIERKRLAEQSERKKACTEALRLLANPSAPELRPLVALRSDRLESDTFWAWAAQRNTPQSFRCFAFHFPRDARAKEALARWQSLDLQDLRTNSNYYALEQFIGFHPQAVIPPEITTAIRERRRDPLVRRVVYTLPETDVARRAADVLLDGLAASNASLRAVAAKGLGEICEVRAVDPLIDALKDQRSGIKDDAARALADIGDKRAESALIEAIKEGNWGAMAAVPKMAPERVYEAFVGDIESADKWARSRIVRVLGQSGDPRAFKPLTACLGDSNEFVRAAAAEALGSYSNLDIPKPLILALRDKSSTVRRSAITSVGKFRDSKVEDELIAAFDAPGVDSFNQVGIAHALLDRGSKRSVDFVFGAIERSRVSDDQGQFVNDLVKIDRSRTYASLLSACRDTRQFWTVRNKAVGLLARIDPMHAAKDLIPLLRDANAFVRKDVVRALGGTGDPEADQALLDVARRDSDSYTRSLAVEAIGAIGDPVMVRDLAGLMKEPDPYLRSAVAKSLGAIGDARAIDVLAAGFADQSGKEWQRVACAVSLAKMDREHALRLLLTELEGTDTEVIASVVSGLGEIGDSRTAGPLVVLLNHENYSVQSAAGYAFGKLQGVGSEVDASLVAMLQASDGADHLATMLGHVLLKHGDPRGIPIMIKAKNYTFRGRAIEEVRDVRCVGELVRLLAAGRDMEREAENALIRIMSENGQQPLLEMLSVEEPLLRMTSAKLISKMMLRDLEAAAFGWVEGGPTTQTRSRNNGSSVVPSALERALLDTDAGVRTYSALAIVRMLGRLEEPGMAR